MSDDQAIPTTGKPAVILRALRSRNYRLFFGGQLISLIGTWLAQVALSWLVYRLTGSKLLLGTVAFCTQIPSLVVAPWAGVLVDRWNLRRTLIWTQMLSMLQAFAVAGLTLTGVITVGEILVLATLLGLINALDMPARQSFVVQILDKREDLPNAIALNSSMFNASRLIGPAIAGVLVGWIGEGWCFLLNGISFIAVIWALLAMQLRPHQQPAVTHELLGDLRAGLRYAFGSLPIRSLLLMVAIVSMSGTPYVVLMPAFARDVLKGGPHTLGLLTASIGCGALIGGLRLASRSSVRGLGKWIVIGAATMGLGLAGFSLSRSLPLSMVCLAVCGFSMITQVASCNTILQTVVDDDKRGRVMSLFGMAFQGIMPLGSLAGGALASGRLGATGTVAIGAGCCVLASLWFLWQLPMIRQSLRPVYIARGVLPG